MNTLAIALKDDRQECVFRSGGIPQHIWSASSLQGIRTGFVYNACGGMEKLQNENANRGIQKVGCVKWGDIPPNLNIMWISGIFDVRQLLGMFEGVFGLGSKITCNKPYFNLVLELKDDAKKVVELLITEYLNRNLLAKYERCNGQLTIRERH